MAQDPLNDPDLIRRAQDGDPDAIEALDECCFAFSHTLAFVRTSDHHHSEDVAQETCLKFWCKFPTIEPARGAKSWVARVAINASRDVLRKKRRRRETTSLSTGADSDTPFDPRGREPDPSEHLTADEIGGPLLSALQHLTPLQRDILVLRFCEGLSAEEAAERLGINAQTVYTETRKARVRLWDVLGPNAPKPFGEPDK